MIIEQLAGFSDRGPTSDFWYSSVAPRTRAGVDIDEVTAMNYSVCWAATRLLAGTTGWLPFKLMKARAGGGADVQYDDPLHALLHDAPNPEMSSMLWRATLVAQQVNWGNCYSEIERNGRDEIVALWPIHASRVTPIRESGTGLFYRVRNNSGKPTDIVAMDMFHVASHMSDDGVCGKGVIKAARESIGHAVGTERYGASWFGSGGQLQGVLEHPGKPEKEARANMRREWNEIYHDPENPQKTAILWEGTKYSSIASNPEDSQFLGSRQFNVEEIARWYGVSPHLVGHLERATFSNIENLGIEFVKYTLMPWLAMWEHEVHRKLLTKPQRAEGYFSKFFVDAVERGDLTSRTAACAQQFFNGALTLNQWCELEDREPVGKLGDVHFVQAAMVPLEIAALGPQKPNQPTPAQDKPADKPTDKPADNPPADASSAAADKQQMAVHAATLDTLSQIVVHMLDKETDAAIHAAKKPNEFLAWLDAFYERHAERMTAALGKPIRACVLASGRPLIVDETLRLAVGEHIAASRSALLEASGGPPDGFAEAIEKCVTSWNRTEIVDLLAGDNHEHS